MPAAEEGLQATIIKLEVENADVIIERAADGKLSVTDLTNSEEVTYSQQVADDQLTIRSKGRYDEVEHAGTIEIYLPDDCRLSCELTSGTLKMTGVRCTSVRAELMSGDIRLNDVTMTSGKLSTMSGDVFLTGRVDSGKVDLSSISGNVRLTLPGNPDTKLDLSSETGEVWFNVRQIGVSMNKTLGKGRGRITATSISGDVEYRTAKTN